MPLRDHWWCILVAKYGAFLFTEIGAFVITDYKAIFYCELASKQDNQNAIDLLPILTIAERRFNSQYISDNKGNKSFFYSLKNLFKL